MWGHGGAANNLRVELHRLRSDFAERGAAVFEDGVDPLALPAAITLETGGVAEMMEGLEDLSPEFSEWLEVQRASQMLATEAPPPGRIALLEELLEQVRAPFVLVLRVRPGSSAAPLARELAARLKMPFVEGVGKGGPALHLLAAEEPAELWRTVATDDAGVWVLERRSLGEDPPLLLTLRSRLPAERLRYLELPPLSWGEARRKQLAELSFDAAARNYLASGGHRGYLRELAALPFPADDPLRDEVQVPQRIRAAYLLEAQKLSADARHALERLSVLPGPYSSAFLDRVGVTQHLDELERLEWLILDDCWSFTDAAARTVLHSSLQNGRRRRYEEEASAFLTDTKRPSGSQHLTPHSALPLVPTVLGHPFSTWSSQPFGPGVTRRDNRFTMVRLGNSEEPSGIMVQLTDEPLLLHLRGRAYAPGGGAHEGALLLKLRPGGRRDAVYLEARERQGGAIDHWFFLEHASSLRLECRTPEAVLEFELGLYFATESIESPHLAFDFRAIDSYHTSLTPDPLEDSDHVEARLQGPSQR